MESGYDKIRNYRSLKGDHFYPFDDKVIGLYPEYKEEIAEKRRELEEAVKELDEVKIKELNQCKRNLLLSISKALELTKNNVAGYPLARNQGLGIPNYVYGKVLGIMQSAMNSAQGFSYPEFYFDPNGNFESETLRNLLTRYHSALEKRRFSSFTDLEDFYTKYENKIRSLWKEENKNYPNPRL
jgi:hypothetical protein